MSEFVMVRRELREVLADTNCPYDQLMAAKERARAVLAQEAGRGEPVAWSYKEYVWATGLGAYVWRDKIEAECPSTDESEIKDLAPLFTSPPAPKLPERHGKQSNLKDTQYAMGWNACLDKVKELNQ